MEQRRGQQCSSKGNKLPPPLPPPRRAREEHRRQTSSGSFSASLLDAIYRSLDEGDDVAVDAAPRRRSEEKATAPLQFWWAATEAGIKPRQAVGADRAVERRRRETAGVARPRHSGYASSTTSSSDSSASSCSTGFSCSSASTTDTESTVRRRRHSPPPLRVSEESSVAADADVTAAAQPKGKRKSKSRPCFPGARFRTRSPSQSSSPKPQQPPSPATFACALKALFTSAARLQRKPKTPAVAAQPLPVSPPAQPQTTSGVPAASAVKGGVIPERSVRFHPGADASVVRRRVEELVRGLEELEEDEEGSDSSSDLFELESLRADELPVYGTTSLAANRAIAQRAAC